MDTDPYVYPGTEILRNTAGLREAAALARLERQVSSIRTDQWAMAPPPVQFSVGYVQRIHQHVFGDVYPWAGELRTVSMAKGETHFAPVHTPVNDLASWGQAVLNSLQREHGLRGLDRSGFVERLGHYMGELNYWHPFREGNGRTTRIFVSQVAKEAGYALDFTRVSSVAWNQAAARSEGDPRAFVEVFQAITSVPRALAFDRESREVALARYPELRGAYATLSALTDARQRPEADAVRAQVRARGRSEISAVLHRGMVVEAPRQNVRQALAAQHQVSR